MLPKFAEEVVTRPDPMAQLPLVVHLRTVAVAQTPEGVPCPFKPLPETRKLHRAGVRNVVEPRHARIHPSNAEADLPSDQARSCRTSGLLSDDWTVIELDGVKCEINVGVSARLLHRLEIFFGQPVASMDFV